MIKNKSKLSWDEFKFQKELRLKSMSGNSTNDRDYFLNLVESQRNFDSNIAIQRFSKKMENYNYKHEGLSKVQYLAHPYRVASLLLENFPNIDDSFIKLALCHNVIEVAEINNKLKHEIGPHLLKYVEILTVNRPMQWNPEYKKNYYKELKKNKITRIIKIFDKLDNLFILSLNANTNIKLDYLAEIKTYLYPFIVSDCPELLEYFETLVNYNYQLIENLEVNDGFRA